MNLSDYIAGLNARLTEAQAGGDPLLAGASILTEDVGELEEAVTAAIEKTGLLILIGQPSGHNTRQSQQVGRLTINSRIEVGENPTLWRDKPGKPVSQDVMFRVIALVQGLSIAGFKKVIVADFVMDLGKKGQLWTVSLESELIVQKTDQD